MLQPSYRVTLKLGRHGSSLTPGPQSHVVLADALPTPASATTAVTATDTHTRTAPLQVNVTLHSSPPPDREEEYAAGHLGLGGEQQPAEREAFADVASIAVTGRWLGALQGATSQPSAGAASASAIRARRPGVGNDRRPRAARRGGERHRMTREPDDAIRDEARDPASAAGRPAVGEGAGGTGDPGTGNLGGGGTTPDVGGGTGAGGGGTGPRGEGGAPSSSGEGRAGKQGDELGGGGPTELVAGGDLADAPGSSGAQVGGGTGAGGDVGAGTGGGTGGIGGAADPETAGVGDGDPGGGSDATGDDSLNPMRELPRTDEEAREAARASSD